MKCSVGLAGPFLKGHTALALAGLFLKGHSTGDGRLGLIGVEVTVQEKMSLCNCFAQSSAMVFIVCAVILIDSGA